MTIKKKQVLPRPLMPRPLKPHPVVLTHPVPQEHLKMPKFWQNFDAILAFTKNTPWKNGRNLTMKILLILSNIWLQQLAQARTTIIYWKQQLFCSVRLSGYLQQYILRNISICMSYFMHLYLYHESNLEHLNFKTTSGFLLKNVQSQCHKINLEHFKLETIFWGVF